VIGEPPEPARPTAREGRIASALARGGAWLPACVAACAALPGLAMPFLSDDWAQVEAAESGPPLRTPFGDFRPLFMATLWLDRRLAGLSPALFHLTNLVLLAATAALVVHVARRYTGDAALATGAGVLFALHPYHVESAAWIAARADPLCAALALAAALAYDRWRVEARGLPYGAILLLEGALLAKESALAVPPALILVGLLDRSRRPRAAEWARGLLPLVLLVLGHFFLLRARALSGSGRTLLGGPAWVRLLNGPGYCAAALLPADIERLVARPALWGALALLAALILLVAARLRSGSLPRESLAASGVFLVLLVPCLVGFQERYLFLPGAASAVAVAALVGAARGRAACLLGGLLAAGWGFAGALQWSDWRQAALASRCLVEDLARASERAGVGEIVIANAPHHVAGCSVAGDLRAALLLSGARPVPVRAGCYISYPRASSDDLDGPPALALRRPPPVAEVWLRVPEGPFSHFVGPRPSALGGGDEARTIETPWGAVLLEGGGAVRVRIRPGPDVGRAAYAWVSGRLQPLF